MGIFDDDDLEFIQQAREEANKFSPLDLNEGNVRTLFDRCLKSADTKEIEYAAPFRKDFGYEEPEAPVHFDREKIKANKKTIMYLFSQLEFVHKGEFSITEEKSGIKYDGSRWTANNGIKAMLWHLAVGAHIMGPFIAKGQKAGIIELAPTLSPKDPKFAAWWETHKGEWEE